MPINLKGFPPAQPNRRRCANFARPSEKTFASYSKSLPSPPAGTYLSALGPAIHCRHPAFSALRRLADSQNDMTLLRAL